MEHERLHPICLFGQPVLIILCLGIYFDRIVIFVVFLSAELDLLEGAFLSVFANLCQILELALALHLHDYVLISVLNLKLVGLRLLSLTQIDNAGHLAVVYLVNLIIERSVMNLGGALELQLTQVEIGIIAPLSPPRRRYDVSLVIFIDVDHVHTLEVLCCVLCGFDLAYDTAFEFFDCFAL